MTDEPSEEIKKLQERKAHLEEVRESYKKAQDVLPFIQNEIETTDWRIRLRTELPLYYWLDTKYSKILIL